MCGRFSFSPMIRVIEERFGFEMDEGSYNPTYNGAPTQNLAVITNDKPTQMSYLKWGLIPFWAKDPRIGSKMINAKAETIAEKPAFRNALKKRRCLVPSNGFYEWRKMNAKDKVPYRIFVKSNEIFCMAGLWETWKDAEERPIHSFTIITTEPNEVMKDIHNRMPVILKKNDEERWLNEEKTDELLPLLKPYASNDMEAYQISPLVNSTRNNSPEIFNPIETLF